MKTTLTLNQGHEIAAELQKRADFEWTQSGHQSIAMFLEEQAKRMSLFADIFNDVCNTLTESINGNKETKDSQSIHTCAD